MSEASKFLALIEQSRTIWQQLPPELQAVFLRLAQDCWEDIQARIGAADPGPAVQLQDLVTPTTGAWAKDLIQRHWPGAASGVAVAGLLQFLSQYFTK